MSISTLESPASRRALDTLQAEQDARTRAADSLTSEFKAATARADGNAIASFAGTTTDWKNKLPGGGYGKRMQPLWEVVQDALDYSDFTQRAMQVLLNAAAGKASQRDAQLLLDELAASWADRNADDFAA